MKLYVISNYKGDWFAQDGEGYTRQLRHAAVFLVLSVAEKVAADGVDGVNGDMVKELNPHAFEGFDFTIDDALRCVWNTALLCEARWAGEDDEDSLWISGERT